MLSAITASASVVITFKASDNYEYLGSMTRKRAINSKETVVLPPGVADARNQVAFEFRGEIKDGKFTVSNKDYITFRAPDGYKIKEVAFQSQSGFDKMGQRFGLKEWTDDDIYQHNDHDIDGVPSVCWTSKNALLQEVSFNLRGNGNATAETIIVTLVKDVEKWLTVNDVFVRDGETKTAGLKLDDYNYDTNGFSTSMKDTGIATYDAKQDQLSGIKLGKTTMTLNFAPDDNYAKGQKTVTVNVVRFLSLPQSDRYTVSATRNDTALAAGAPLWNTDRIKYHVEAANGYRVISSVDTTLSGAEDFPTPVALPVDFDGSLLIGDTADWEGFRKYYFNAGQYRLSADIGPVTTMVGSKDKPFTGSFDGGGHTLTVNYKSDTDIDVAPFRFVGGAIFTNLRTAGTISASQSPGMAAGLIGDVLHVREKDGNSTTIRNCESAVALTFTGSGDATFGGFVGRVAESSVIFFDCIFSGSMTATDGKCVGGFVGWNSAWADFYDCLVAADFNVKEGADANGNATFARTSEARRVRVYNSFYREYANLYDGFRQGTKLTDQQVANGEAAWGLQNGRNGNRKLTWGQNISGDNKDAHPVLTNDNAKRLWRAAFKAWDTAVYYAYGNDGKLFNSEGRARRISGDVTATGDIDINAFRMSDGYILIEQADDWDFLADVLGKGYSGGRSLQVRLMNDIGVRSMVGSDDNPFRGTFDGGGHKINVNYNYGQEYHQAPFRVVSGATLQDLRIDGTIGYEERGGDQGTYPGGMVGKVIGDDPTLISRCAVYTRLNGPGNRNSWGGGVVGYVSNSNLTIDNTLFNGYFYRGNHVGGMVGRVDGKCVISNCLMIGSGKDSNGAHGTGNFFSPNFGGGDKQIVNCYYMMRWGEEWVGRRYYDHRIYQGGTATTYEKLASGETAWLLQGNQPVLAWGQNITEGAKDTNPYPTSDAGKRVWKASVTNIVTKATNEWYTNNGHYFNTNGFTIASPADFATTPATADVDNVQVFQFAKDASGFNVISTVDDWNRFAAYVTEGQYRLGADINGVATMAGTEQRPFKGVFDGGGHTLNVDITGTTQFTAPFAHVENATIRNLNVAGKVHQAGTGSSVYHASGLVGRANGLTLDRCCSSVDLTFNDKGDVHSGGLVGHALSSTINVSDCAFTGSFSEPNDRNNASVGGIVGWGETTCKVNISNSYVDLTLNNIPGLNCFLRANNGWTAAGSTFANNFYILPDGATDHTPNQGSRVTREQTQSGYVVNLLQKPHGNAMVWGQHLGADSRPHLTADSKERVCRVDFTNKNDGKVLETRFVQNGDTTLLPTFEQIKPLFGKYNETDYYKVTFDNGFTAHTKVTADMNVPFSWVRSGSLWIRTAADWDELARVVEEGQPKVRAALDDDLSDITTMVGTEQKPYGGHFDGMGHTLTVNLQSADPFCAPFRSVSGAEIVLLKTAGTVTSGASHASGLVGRSSGVRIRRCEVGTDLHFTSDGEQQSGGLIGYAAGGKADIDQCAFNGTFSSPDSLSFYGVGGFVGWGDLDVTITNSYAHNPMGSGCQWYYPFVNRSGSAQAVTLQDCIAADFGDGAAHFDNGNEGVAKVSRQQTENGYATWALQRLIPRLEGHPREPVWGQLLDGTDLKPHVIVGDLDNGEMKVIRNAYTPTDTLFSNSLILDENKNCAYNLQANDTLYLVNVKLKRSFADGWNTLVLPFAISVSQLKYVLGSDVQIAVFSNETENAIDLSIPENEFTIIETNEPVLVKTSAGSAEYTFNACTVTPVVAPMKAGDYGINFVGNYDSLYTVKSGECFIANAKLWKSVGSTKLKPTRAYFTLPEASADAKIMFYINGESGTTTGVSASTVDGMGDNDHDSAVFTLSGQKVADSLDAARRLHLQPGVYIVNGKKIVIK